MRRLTQESVKNKLKEKHLTLLSEYKNNRTKLWLNVIFVDMNGVLLLIRY